MGAFLKSENARHVAFKTTHPSFSDAARAEGLYNRRPRPFCLPVAHAEESLAPEIRHAALVYFATHRIPWHQGHHGQPSNHLCSSQVCCVNFLFPFAHRPDALATVLRPLFPTLRAMCPVEDGQYVAFEWIGQENYLRERTGPTGVRTRGAYGTSADAMVMFERVDRTRHIVLIAWTYAEAYTPSPLRSAKNAADRTECYHPFFDRKAGPLCQRLVPRFEVLFVEPFYQLMRQQFLASAMEEAKELGATTVSVLHIAPAHNTDFRRMTALSLISLGATPTTVWTKLVRPPDRFLSVSTEALFGHLSAAQLPDMGEWLAYIHARYPWVRETHVPASSDT